MGVCASADPQMSAQDLQAEKSSASALNEKLAKDKATDQLVHKILLLGGGGSGKSTIFKQMITIYGEGFPEPQRKLFIKTIHNNVVFSMQVLCQQAGSYQPAVAPALADIKRRVEEIKEGEPLTEEYGQMIKQLWADPGIQQTYEARANFQLTDSAAYYFEKINEISHPNYLPTEQDVLRSRVPTTGIVEETFIVEGSVFRMFDVGGQRSERHKWIHCFENVTAILFVAAISAYDEVLYEDATANRMVESLTLFEEICNSHWFRDTSMILFLNKRDIFEQKIKKVPLTKCFPNYNGDISYAQTSEFVRQEFLKKNANPDAKTVYTHFTCACNTDNMATVFNVVKDIVIKQGLARSGLL